MLNTVTETDKLNKKNSLIKSVVEPQLKMSDLNQKNIKKNQMAQSLPTQIRTLTIKQSNSSQNIQNQRNTKLFRRHKESTTRPVVKLGQIKQLVRNNSRSSKKPNQIVNFHSPQHTNPNKNKPLINQPPKILKEGIITHIQPPSVIKNSTMKNLNQNPQKLFKICEQDALDNIFLKSKEQIIKSAKVIQVQNLNDSLNFWKQAEN